MSILKAFWEGFLSGIVGVIGFLLVFYALGGRLVTMPSGRSLVSPHSVDRLRDWK